MNTMKLFITVFIITFVLSFGALLFYMQEPIIVNKPVVRERHWEIRSIDTMKYSRDRARDMKDKEEFDIIIDRQMDLIARTDANYVTIDTPYDEEFNSVLRRWVTSARKYKLSIWFRGNFSGWEGWFDYPKISKDEHIKKTISFILENQDIFKDGDIFDACPECENGAKVTTKNLSLHRQFLVEEYEAKKEAFREINKNVHYNFHSMNGDIAKSLMDEETTRMLGGVVVIDHYVPTTDRLARDIVTLAKQSGGTIVLGEFGVPIPGIHKQIMSDADQKQWIEDALEKVVVLDEVKGINYWVNMGGTSAIWHDNGDPKPAWSVIKTYYSKEEVKK